MLTCVLLLVAVASAAAAPPATAAPGVQFGLADDAWLQDGPGTLSSRLASLDALGVQIVRFTLNWNQIASTRPATPASPNDPAYNWTSVDTVVNALRTHGVGVVLQLVGTPTWANGGHGPNYAPTSAATFASFARAAALRYPWVKRWLIWNEPNQRRWLLPTSPTLYTTRLLNPAYAAIHRAIPGAQVGGGVTAPRGSSGGVSPVAWIAGMHAAHARLDAYAHNPYPLDPKVETPLTGACGHCTTLTMATLGRLETLVAHDFARARIWLTEYGYQTNPPDRLLGVSQALQARYIGEAAYQAFRTPRVDMLIQYLYRDEPNIARFQSGLVKLNGARKPAFAAFELPLAETGRTGSTVALWGQLRSPSTSSTARLEAKRGAAWRTLATLRAGTGGYVMWRGALAPGTWVRLVSGGVAGAQVSIR
jgi:cellulase (glycosyl hydrolase family 5)